MKFTSRVYCFLVFTLLASCSQFSNSPTSKAWHNMNAKYNALLLAREDYKYALKYIQENNTENYESILPIFTRIDSTKLDSAKFLLIDAVKKSSIIAEKHSNSKFLDEAYLILGKSRLQKQEFFNAIETFKYVNSNSKNKQSQIEALIWLMRSYIVNNDLNTANQVSDLLKKEKLNKKNKSIFLITKAYYHQTLKEDALAVVFLEEGLKTYPKGKQKARLHFIAAQLYEQLNKPIFARKNFNSALKNKPFYDLEFNCKLGLIMSESLAKNTNLQFNKLINDRKNQDLLDKIYYKMGELETKKNNLDLAIENFNKSIAASTDNEIQKAFSYKAIADIYFDIKNDFETASVYYDSTMITMPKDIPQYKSISQKAMSLNDFIKFNKVLVLEDSLQKMALMNPNELDYKLEKIITDKRNNQKKAQETLLAKQDADALNSDSKPNQISKSQKTWLFYDVLEYNKSKNEFFRIWGNRKLEDNWRRSEKETGGFSLKIEKSGSDIAQSTNKKTESLDDIELQEKQEFEREKAEIQKKLPKTQIQLMASNRKKEEAYFQLGKIYKLKFENDVKAKKMFLVIVDDFKNSVYEPESLYFLSLMESKSGSPNMYEARLIKNHPYSSFSRLLVKGNVKLSQNKETEVLKLYSDAYKLYESQKFTEALAALDNILNEYGGSQIEDKIALLRIYVLAKFDNKEQYMVSLNDFLRSYPTSDLSVKAKEMLEVYNSKQ